MGPAGAQGVPPAVQTKLAAAKQMAAQNQVALRGYTWIETTQISVKDEVKNTKIESCRYGPDGKVQRTELSEPPPDDKKFGIRGAIQAKKTGEMKDQLESANALVRQYIPPDPNLIQHAITVGKASLAQRGPGVVALIFADYLQPGDSLTLTLDSQAKALKQISVATWMDDPGNKVSLDVDMQLLPDGTNYPATSVLQIPGSQIQVQIKNSNYQRVVP